MSAKPKKTSKDRIDVGDQVIHVKFGVGTVLHKIGDGEDAKLTVAFPEKGQKKLLAKYAKLKRVRGGKAVEDEEEETVLGGKSVLDAAKEKEDEEENEEVEVEEIGDDDDDEDEDEEDEWEEKDVEEMYDEEEEEDDDADEEAEDES